MNRQEAVIKTERMNRLSKQLNYWVDLGAPFTISSIDKDATSYGDWAKEIQVFLLENPVESIIDRIEHIPSSDALGDYLIANRSRIDKPVFESLIRYATILNEMQVYYGQIHIDSKGEYKMLPDGLDNEKGYELLLRCVNAGFLDVNFMPIEGRKRSVLKVIAFAISQLMGFKVRHRWSVFEKMWAKGKGKLCSEALSNKNMPEYKKVMALFPEVDFTELFAPKYHLKFDCPYPATRIKAMYNELYNGRYISPETTYQQFLGVFGKSKCSKPVNWIREQRLLGYFIKQTFRHTNANIWNKAVSRFVINGEMPHHDSLASGYNSLAKAKVLDTYDITLRDIALKYNRK